MKNKTFNSPTLAGAWHPLASGSLLQHCRSTLFCFIFLVILSCERFLSRSTRFWTRAPDEFFITPYPGPPAPSSRPSLSFQADPTHRGAFFCLQFLQSVSVCCLAHLPEAQGSCRSSEELGNLYRALLSFNPILSFDVASRFPCLERVVQQWRKSMGGPTRVHRLVPALYILIIALVALNNTSCFFISFDSWGLHLQAGLFNSRFSGGVPATILRCA